LKIPLKIKLLQITNHVTATRCPQSHKRGCGIKLAFHDADTDTDSLDTSIHRYVRYVRYPREDHREEVGVGVRVGVMECQL